MTGPGTLGGKGKEEWETATMAEEDSLMKEAVELMKQWKAPADFRQFVADCFHFGGGAVGEWERELDVRKWSLQLLKAAIADGSVFSGDWDSLPYSAVLPVPMPAFMLENALAYELEVAAGKSRDGSDMDPGHVTSDADADVEEGTVCVSKGGDEKMLDGDGEVSAEVKVEVEGKAESLSPLSPCWGAALPPPGGSEEAAAYPWRPWEEEGGEQSVIGDVWKLEEEESKESSSSCASSPCRKRRSKAAAARSLGRLLKWQEKLEPQLGPSRLQLELRCATPCMPERELKRTNLASKFDGESAELCLRRGVFSGGVGMLGAQAMPQHGVLSQDLMMRGGGERGGLLGLGATNLFASTSQPFPLLQQFSPPISPGASIYFPIPPPSGG